MLAMPLFICLNISIILELKPAYLLYVQGVKDSFDFLSRYGLVHRSPSVVVAAARHSNHERGLLLRREL